MFWSRRKASETKSCPEQHVEAAAARGEVNDHLLEAVGLESRVTPKDGSNHCHQVKADIPESRAIILRDGSNHHQGKTLLPEPRGIIKRNGSYHHYYHQVEAFVPASRRKRPRDEGGEYMASKDNSVMQIEAALGRLEKKLKVKESESSMLFGGGDGGANTDRSRYPWHREPSLHNGMVDLSATQHHRDGRPVPSGGLASLPFSYGERVSSPAWNDQVFSRSGFVHNSDVSSEQISTSSKEAYLIHSDRDSGTSDFVDRLEMENIEGERNLHSRRTLYNGGRPHITRRMCNKVSNSHANYQWLEEIFSEQKRKKKHRNAYLCSFCRTYYLYYNSYEKHLKDCLTCLQCKITFRTTVDFHQHIASKPHQGRPTFMTNCKLTQAELELHIYRKEVFEGDVERLKKLSYTLMKERCS